MKLNNLLDELYALNRLGIRPGLATEQALLTAIGNPEKHLSCIHIAGTNGKGSVSAMLESVLRAAGLRTGLYTSPHLIRFNERIRCAGKCITDDALLELLPPVLDAGRRLGNAPGGASATFFEIVTAAAFLYFAKMRPDVVILETGMGGRLDATNVIVPLASVITGISLEHTAYLGGTVAEIAREKCGIIKPGRPVIVGNLPAVALAEAQAAAKAANAPLIEAAAAARVSRRKQDFDGQRIRIETAAGAQISLNLPLSGRHQLHNTALAVSVLEQVFKDTLPADALKQGLQQVFWPARMQMLARDPPLILDAAHNPEGAAACAATLRELLPAHAPLGLVVAMCDDKNLDGFLGAFSGRVKRCWAAPLRNPRGRSAAEIAAAAARRGWEAVVGDSLAGALDAAREWAAGTGGAVCAAGSLFMAGEILEKIYPGGDLFGVPSPKR